MNKTCFIICPIGEENSETRKRSDTVYDYLLAPVCSEMKYDIIRADKISDEGKIDTEIIKYLDTSDLVIADLTDLNPNVFYEVGYRNSKCLPCIQIATDGTKLPFDVSSIRTQFYTITDLAKAETFKTSIKNVIVNIESRIKSSDTVTNLVDAPTIEQEILNRILDRMYNLEYAFQDFIEITEKNLADIDKHINNFRGNQNQTNQTEQFITETFLQEVMKNPTKAKTFIDMLKGDKSL